MKIVAVRVLVFVVGLALPVTAGAQGASDSGGKKGGTAYDPGGQKGGEVDDGAKRAPDAGAPADPAAPKAVPKKPSQKPKS